MTQLYRLIGTAAAALAVGCVPPNNGDGDAGDAPDYNWTVLTEGAALAVATTADGDIVVAGRRAGDVWLARFDGETGDELWSTTRDWAGGPDEATSVAVGGAQGDAVYVVGTAWTGGNADPSSCEDPEGGCPQFFGIWIAEFDLDGALRWDDVYAPMPESDNEGTAVALGSDGYPVVAGRLSPSMDGGAWIRRYGPEAAVVWETVIPAYASATDIAVTAEDAVYVADGRQHRLHMLDADGVLNWTVETNDNSLIEIALTPEGDLAAVSSSGDAYGIEADGMIAWTFSPTQDVWGEGVAIDPSGRIAVVGSALASDYSQRQIWAQGVDPDGAPTWGFQHWFGEPPVGTDTDVDSAAAATFLDDGDLVLVGSVYEDGSSSASAWLARWSPP